MAGKVRFDRDGDVGVVTLADPPLNLFGRELIDDLHGALEEAADRAMASAVTTPHPPAVVTTTTRLPRGRGWVAKVAAVSNASSIDVARTAPA